MAGDRSWSSNWMDAKMMEKDEAVMDSESKGRDMGVIWSVGLGRYVVY